MTNNFPTPTNRLYRSSTDKYLAGVCGGIAQHFGWDPALVRIMAVLGAVVFHVFSPIIYIIAAIVMPKNPTA
ncbi:PspC domain-containing protein [Corynebacterium aquilae]|uniref:Phage shock protein PspC N-terminal domain-containing protein n=1 Tax=Corynebacterium aquilae DSM 44791 TaxID=1431546 RepID=A0A1L7CE67_9CORY|nr:PspC domain-containing protein [Corynebacterium aquilae]APT84136.1 hypothetical protein CAQU_02575 [Corynebacterium aquilae DSM 44791]